MRVLTSADGTVIAYDRRGDGPALVLVDGAMCTRWFGSKPALVDLLAAHFSVYVYDRRGRGDSGDTLPYTLEREIEDIETLVDTAGGRAYLYGHSSGAALAMEATVELGLKVKGLALYDAPYNDDPEAQKAWHQYLEQLAEALAEDRRGDAIALFMGLVGIPAEQIAGMRHASFWPGFEAVAPTLVYDHAVILGEHAAVPTHLAERVAVPTLVIHGGAGAAFMGTTARTLSQAIPLGKLRTLPDQAHDVDAGIVGALLVDFFLAGGGATELRPPVYKIGR